MLKSKKLNHNNFMTDKEKSYVCYCLSKNIKRGIRMKDYRVFFTTKKLSQLRTTKIKENNKKKPDTLNKELSVNKKIIKEILTTNLVKSQKKSRKTPRPMLKNENMEISESLNYMIKLENLFDKLVLKMYNLENEQKNEDGTIENTNEIEFNEDDFFYFLDFGKFFNFLTLAFNHYENEVFKKKVLIFLFNYSIKIKHQQQFNDFLVSSSAFLPKISDQDIEGTDFLNYFYFNACNFIFAREILKVMPSLWELFYKYLSNDNLELIFSLECDVVAWEFLAVFIKLLDDEKKAEIVVLIKDKVLETADSDDKEKIAGLTIFLDSIGIEIDDLK